MLYLAGKWAKPDDTPEKIVEAFKVRYPDYAPAEGMRLYAQQWLEKKLTAA